MPPYSVLMSVYTKEEPAFLRTGIESMLTQTVPPSDFVIVCDGPLTKQLDEVINPYAARYPQVFQIIRLPENMGQGMALQKGIVFCKNELIARMDSDDISVASRCELQLDVFTANPALSVVGGQIEEFTTNPETPYATRTVPLTSEAVRAYAKKRNPFNHMTVMIKKSHVLNAGNYQPFPLFEDYWLWVRLLHSGSAGVNLPYTLVKARAGLNMISRRGGWAYAKKHAAFQKAIYNLGFIKKIQMIKNILIRVSVSIMPERLRGLIYNKALRR